MLLRAFLISLALAAAVTIISLAQIPPGGAEAAGMPLPLLACH